MSNNSSSPEYASPRAPVIGVQESLVTIDVSRIPVMKNEVGYILVGDERLKAEVLRVQGDSADMQVFEDTSGVKVGDEVELTGEMLSVALGMGSRTAQRCVMVSSRCWPSARLMRATGSSTVKLPARIQVSSTGSSSSKGIMILWAKGPSATLPST